jgi:hypothetical protein
MSRTNRCTMSIVSLFLLFVGAAGAAADQQTMVRLLPRQTPATTIALQTDYGKGGVTIKVKNGAPPYTVVPKDPAVARVTQIDGVTFRIEGTVTGITSLRITDSKGNALDCDLLAKTVIVKPR